MHEKLELGQKFFFHFLFIFTDVCVKLGFLLTKKMNLEKLLCSSLKVSRCSNFPRIKLKTLTTEALISYSKITLSVGFANTAAST